MPKKLASKALTPALGELGVRFCDLQFLQFGVKIWVRNRCVHPVQFLHSHAVRGVSFCTKLQLFEQLYQPIFAIHVVLIRTGYIESNLS